MPAGRYDITIEQGATYTQKISVTDNTGAKIDFNGCTLSMQIKENYDDETPLAAFELSIDSEGDIAVYMSDENTNLLEPTCGTAGYVYDLICEYLSGRIDRFLAGRVAVTPGVSDV